MKKRIKEAEKMSNQGLWKLTEGESDGLKALFNDEFIEKGTGSRTGYFVGWGLIKKILAENKTSEGLLISFGLNRGIEKDGEIQLIFEAANSNEANGIIEGSQKYGTGVPGVNGPDGVLPAIKPTPKPPTSKSS